MSGDIINLRKVRKARARDEAARLAAENRARFGRSKTARIAEQYEKDRTARLLEGARLDDSD